MNNGKAAFSEHQCLLSQLLYNPVRDGQLVLPDSVYECWWAVIYLGDTGIVSSQYIRFLPWLLNVKKQIFN